MSAVPAPQSIVPAAGAATVMIDARARRRAAAVRDGERPAEEAADVGAVAVGAGLGRGGRPDGGRLARAAREADRPVQVVRRGERQRDRVLPAADVEAAARERRYSAAVVLLTVPQVAPVTPSLMKLSSCEAAAARSADREVDRRGARAHGGAGGRRVPAPGVGHATGAGASFALKRLASFRDRYAAEARAVVLRVGPDGEPDADVADERRDELDASAPCTRPSRCSA